MPSVTLPSGYVGIPATADMDVSAISRQMTLVQKLIAENSDVQNMIGQRLNAVLRPSSPSVDQSANGSPRPVASPLADDLERFAMSLQALLRGYEDILSRLEL